MSWKDYLYFTKSQRIGLWMMIILILLVIIIDGLLCYKRPSAEGTKSGSTFYNEALRFKKSLKNLESPYYSYKKRELQAKEISVQRFKFDPNILDSSGFIKLGLSPFIAHNILKYRSKGGKFKQIKDFSKIYSLKPAQFVSLKPFINIATKKKDNLYVAKMHSIELNSTDTNQLKQIKGMPPWIARRIVAYRKRLGGYVSINQLTEVWGLTPNLLQKIGPVFTIDISKINKIEINEAGINDFRRHPYFNFYQSKAIYNYRKKNGQIKSFNELKNINNDQIDDAFLKKIKPYLSF